MNSITETHPVCMTKYAAGLKRPERQSWILEVSCQIRLGPKFRKERQLSVKKVWTSFLAVGGGSVIDCCKIISAQAKTDDDVWDMFYNEHRLPTEFIPCGAVVTASGTGAEQNNGAVITHEEKKLKQALFGAFHRFAVLDSDLTLTLPMKQVISGAFDTLSHCMETYMGQPLRHQCFR